MAVDIPYRREMTFDYGRVRQVSPLIRRIVARNPSPYTLYGTGTYIVGAGEVAVIDPGPADSEHIKALALALEGEKITCIPVTHTHNDHSPGVPLLQKLLPAPSCGYGRHGQGKLQEGIQVEEGGDMDFVPDIHVRHGDVLKGPGWTLECIHTPGHTSNHMCYRLREEQALFTGDHVMGWSTSVISPPDGDMTQYMQSLALLLDSDDMVYWPTHGPPIRDPQTHVRAFIAHRREREDQVLRQLHKGAARIVDMVPDIYAQTPVYLHPAAARSLLATILHLVADGRVLCEGEAGMDTVYRAASAS